MSTERPRSAASASMRAPMERAASSASTPALVAAAVRVLDAGGALERLRDAAAELGWELAGRPAHAALIAVDVDVDVRTTLDQCYELAALVVWRPRTAAKLFQQLLCEAVAALNLLPCSVPRADSVLHPSQVLVRLRPFNLVTGATSLRCVEKLQSFTGILSSLTLPQKYVESSRLLCKTCGEGRFHHHFPGQPPPAAVADCTRCGSSLREDVSCRQVAELRCGWLLPLEALESPLTAGARRSQALRVCFRGATCAALSLGGRLCVVGVAARRRPAEPPRLEALTVRPVPLTVYAAPLSCALSPVIESLYHDRRFSPWSFALSLAYVFCGAAAPAGTYFRLKLGMLLSLVACGALRHGHCLPVLAVGADVSTLRRLQQRGAAFCRRRVQHAPGGSALTGQALSQTARHDGGAGLRSTEGAIGGGGGGGAVELEAGSLLLARGGVCLLGDLSKYRRADLQLLQKCMELGSVPISRPAAAAGGGGGSCSEPLRQPLLCQPWALFDRSPAQLVDADASLVADAAGARDALPRPLTEAFGLVYQSTSLDDADDLAVELAVGQLLVQARAGPAEPQLIPDTELQTFLAAAAELSLEMEPSAEALLRGYFVASRRVRATPHVPDVPTAALNTLWDLAHAFAQLSLRSAVTADDATMAILLYEESLAACFAYSPLGVSHEPHVRHSQLDANLGKQNDERMREFQQTLHEFVAEWAE